jgi:hypothetical protein
VSKGATRYPALKPPNTTCRSEIAKHTPVPVDVIEPVDVAALVIGNEAVEVIDAVGPDTKHNCRSQS